MKFAAFIITYERPGILVKTIESILSQTFPPEKVLVVDNSLSNSTCELLKNIDNSKIEYFRVGYNAGPAGASKIGLEKLAKDGYDYIYWADDDNPPFFENDLEKILEIHQLDKNIGIASAVGNRFNQAKVKYYRHKNEELNGILDVNAISGSDIGIINAEVIKRGIFPDPKLFFCFEDLDFCVKVKEAGFQIKSNGDLHLKYRQHKGRINLKHKRRTKPKRSIDGIWRDYYSMRNLIYLTKNNWKLKIPLIRLLGRTIVKSLLGYSKGIRFGYSYQILMFKAIKDGLKGNMGLTIKPGSKR